MFYLVAKAGRSRGGSLVNYKSWRVGPLSCRRKIQAVYNNKKRVDSNKFNVAFK